LLLGDVCCRETRNDRRNIRKPLSFLNHPQLCNGLDPQERGKHFWGKSRSIFPLLIIL
jgi:hypothetical protein